MYYSTTAVIGGTGALSSRTAESISAASSTGAVTMPVVLTEDPVYYCTFHPSVEADLYCKTCSANICTKCAYDKGPTSHNSHDFELIGGYEEEDGDEDITEQTREQQQMQSLQTANRINQKNQSSLSATSSSSLSSSSSSFPSMSTFSMIPPPPSSSSSSLSLTVSCVRPESLYPTVCTVKEACELIVEHNLRKQDADTVANTFMCVLRNLKSEKENGGNITNNSNSNSNNDGDGDSGDIDAYIVPGEAIKCIIDLLSKHYSNVYVCVCGMEIISELADKYSEKLDQYGVCQVVVSILCAHSVHEKVALEACTVICKLTQRNDFIARKMSEIGVCKGIASIFKSHSSRFNVMEWAWRAVVSLAGVKNGHLGVIEAMGEAGLCELVVVSCKIPPTTVAARSVRDWAILAMLKLCELDENSLKLGKAGVLDIIVNNLKTSTSPEFGEKAFRMMVYLNSLPINSFLKKLHQKSTIETVVYAIQKFEEDRDVSLWGCKAFRDLSSNEGNPKKFGAASGCDVILNVLKIHSHDADISENAWAAICNLAQDENNARELYSGGVCEILIDALKTHMTSPDVCELIFATVVNLADDRNSNAHHIGLLGGCETIVNVLNHHRHVAAVSDQGCWAISCLCDCGPEVSKANKDRFGIAGAAETIVNALKTHSSDAFATEHAFSAISNLCHQHNINKMFLGLVGASEVIVQTLGVYAPNLSVAEWACRAIEHLSDDNIENAERLGDAGACEKIISSALALHSSDLTVCSLACKSLWNLCQFPPNLSRIHESMGCQALLKSLSVHINSQEVSLDVLHILTKLAENEPQGLDFLNTFGGGKLIINCAMTHRIRAQICEAALHLIALMGDKDKDKDKWKATQQLSQAGCVEMIASILSSTVAEDAAVSEAGCRCLANFCVPNHAVLIFNAGLCTTVVNILDSHRQDVAVVASALKVINRICSMNPDMPEKFSSPASCSIIISVLETHMQNEFICARALSIIFSLCSASTATNDIRASLGRVSVCKNVVQTMIQHKLNHIIISNGLKTMYNLSKSDINTIQFGVVGACQVICDVINDFMVNNPDIMALACSLLAILGRCDENVAILTSMDHKSRVAREERSQLNAVSNSNSNSNSSSNGSGSGRGSSGDGGGDGGSVYASILYALNLHRSNMTISEKLWAALCRISTSHPTHLKNLRAVGLAEHIISALNVDYPTSGQICSLNMKILCHMITNEINIIPYFLQGGIFPLLLDTLKTYRDNMTAAQNILRVICTLCKIISEPEPAQVKLNDDTIVIQSGVLETINANGDMLLRPSSELEKLCLRSFIDALPFASPDSFNGKGFTTALDLTSMGLNYDWYNQGLVTDSFNATFEINPNKPSSLSHLNLTIDADEIDAAVLVQCLQTHLYDSFTCTLASVAIFYLCQNNNHIAVKVGCIPGCCEALVISLAQHAQDALLVESICLLTRRLCMCLASNEIRHRLCVVGVCEAVTRGMGSIISTTPNTDPKVVENVLKSIIGLTTNHNENATKLLSAGLCANLTKLSSLYISHETICESIIMLLRNLSANSQENTESLAQCGVIPLVNKLIFAHVLRNAGWLKDAMTLTHRIASVYVDTDNKS